MQGEPTYIHYYIRDQQTLLLSKKVLKLASCGTQRATAAGVNINICLLTLRVCLMKLVRITVPIIQRNMNHGSANYHAPSPYEVHLKRKYQRRKVFPTCMTNISDRSTTRSGSYSFLCMTQQAEGNPAESIISRVQCAPDLPDSPPARTGRLGRQPNACFPWAITSTPVMLLA